VRFHAKKESALSERNGAAIFFASSAHAASIFFTAAASRAST
jgi:hypothetical protein